jgi:hypothetical protein
MNPLILFDYVFYQISNFFGNIPAFKYSKELNGITMLSFLQNLNLFTLLNFFELNKINGNQYVLLFFLCLIILFVLNYFRYIKSKKYKSLNYNWNTDKGYKKVVKNTLTACYCLGSLVLIIIV